MELHSRSIGDFCQVNIEILPLARLKKENIVAVVHLGEFVQFVQARLLIKLDVFPPVWKHRCEVIEKVSVPISPQDS